MLNSVMYFIQFTQKMNRQLLPIRAVGWKNRVFVVDR